MLKILIVDDSIVTRRQITKLATNLGHEVVATAKNSTEAFEAHDRCEIDLTTMDITMPGVDGISTAKNILMAKPSAKIIMVTSQGQEEMVVDAMKAGALGYILKPITRTKFEEVIKRVFPKSNN